ncbi:DUF3506 domain protein [Metarhizium robertsii]|uniref:DUF3506 domain protein n=1 Tax=Metarhizium robertsii TaxID=568076 RepID=A0A0A1V4E3_9HYPO|nr:DUF3506 domain protein [Metarhizium robertsii]
MAGFAASRKKRSAEPAHDSRTESTTTSDPSSSHQRPPKRQAPSPTPNSPPARDLPGLPDNQIRDLLPIVPTSATTSPSNYGRINAENETNLVLLESMPNEVNHYRQRILRKMSGQISTASGGDHHETTFADLPSVAATCRKLHRQAISDIHWLRCIQHNVPGLTLTNPGPCSSFRELYIAHDPVWFLPKYKIWFCDRDLTGKLIVVRFDPRRGCIEGYQLVAVSNRNTFEHWPTDSQVIIHGFEPQVKLHLDKPVLQFDAQDRQKTGNFSVRQGANRFASEKPMARGNRSDPMFSNFLLTRPLDPEKADEKLAADYPYDHVWPPPTIPARHHVSGARSGQAVIDLSQDDRPRSRGEVSDQTFRIRQWMQMPGTPPPPSLIGGQAGSFTGMVQVLNGLTDADNVMLAAGAMGVHIGEEVITYSTLDPVLYTPTSTKPWRGIWVGDYSGHGCEFLLINQPDDPHVTDAELGLVRDADETDEAWERRRREAHMYRGRLEAIKLTGDPNVPRGEYTFVSDDLGPGGYVGVATDPPFAGARVVKSKGHVAATGFIQVYWEMPPLLEPIADGIGVHAGHADKYIESQLLLIGPNRLAQYWVGFGHISFFERVQVDDLIIP